MPGVKENEIQSVDLFMTERCNMDCTYCFHKKGEDSLNVEQGKKILDALKKISPLKMHIEFFGGEPTLEADAITILMGYAMELWGMDAEGKSLATFGISTNGTFFNSDVFSQWKIFGLQIQVSFDGDRLTMDEHRKGDFDLIVSNIKMMKEFFSDISIRMTYTPVTVGRLAGNVKFIVEELGIVKIMHHAVMEADWNEESLQKYIYQLRQLYHYRRFIQRKGIPVNILFIDKTLRQLNDEEQSDINYCAAGKSYIAILPNGDVYPCHRAASNRLYKLGNIFNERPFIRGMFLTLSKDASAGCWKNCEASRTCHSCPITHHIVNGDLITPIKKYCEICKAEFNMAKGYLSTELNDRTERSLNEIKNMQLKIGNALLQLNERINKGDPVYDK